MVARMSWFQRRYSFLCTLLIVVLVLYLWVSVVNKKKSPRYSRISHSVNLLTLNIWFGEHKVKERMAAIGHTVETLSPAIITFQEVTNNNLGFLQSQPWFSRYHMVPNKRPANQYFVIILSVYPILKWRNIPFKNSIMGRNLLLAELKVEIKSLEPSPSEVKSKVVYFTISDFPSGKHGLHYKRTRASTPRVFGNIIWVRRCLFYGRFKLRAKS